MENKKNVTATQQPITQQHIMAHHVHPDQIYSPQHSQLPAHINNQSTQIQPNGVMHQLLQSQYQSNMNARSPLLENRHEMYGTGHNHDYARHYGANDNYNYPQSPPRLERTEIHTDHNVNHELLHNIPKGYNAEVYQDYLKRNPPKDSNQIYQNHQPMYRPNVNQYGTKPYLPYSNRIGPQSNTELLRKQYNEIQQMKMQQQMHYQNQAQMHQQQKFAERQLLLQQIHGVQPPPNLQNSIYSDSSYRDLDRYSSKNDFKDYSSTDLSKDLDRYSKNNEYKDLQNRHYQDSHWQSNQGDFRELERQRPEQDKAKSNSPPSDFNQKNFDMISPMKSSESSTPTIKSPSSDSRRSSSGTQLRSPTAQRIPSAPVTLSGMLYKQGSDGLKVWRKRWFVLSEYCLFYYKSQDEEKLLGSVLLPSYKVSACTAEDKVMRKFAFKLEHANMRTYVLAALDQESMIKWVKALTLAALMQTSNEQQQKQIDRAAAKIEDGDEAGPTYANAPPKPRRANDGYNSPSPDMYDPNYDLLKKPASHYSQGTSHTRYQDTTYSTKQEIYTRSPQSPPSQPQPPYQTKRPYDMQQLSLPLSNTAFDNPEKTPNTPSINKSNPQSPYFDNRSARNQQQQSQEDKIENLYEKKSNYNPFLQDYGGRMEQKTKDDEKSRSVVESNKTSIYNESYPESRTNPKTYVDANVYGREVYGDVNMKANKPSTMNERLAERRTPDAYGRSTVMSAYNTEKIGDYEDIYAAYGNETGKAYAKSPNPSQPRDTISLSSHKSPQDQPTHSVTDKTFSGPSVLRRKKMQASGIQPPIPRPHSADFLEYESKNEALYKVTPTRNMHDPPKQPPRPKSSLDINSYYDPSSDKYYSEESYAQKMRQSAQYLQQQGLAPKNIQIPLEKYASGLAEKQLHSPYTHPINNNYETEFSNNKNIRDNVSYNSKYSDLEGLNSNWTLREKELEIQKDYLNRSGSVMSDGSHISAYVKDAGKFDPGIEGFMRSASARLPSSTEREGEKKVQQREESMKRLLEWKQRMLQSPLTRKSTPATISLSRSLNQSRQSLRSDQYKPKTYKNASYNSYSSDDEEETPGTDLQNTSNIQAGRSHKAHIASPTLTRLTSPHTLSSPSLAEHASIRDKEIPTSTENVYENILCTVSIPKDENVVVDNDTHENKESDSDMLLKISQVLENRAVLSNEMEEDGYETQNSEAESETQIEYTDNDLDEVLLASDTENENHSENKLDKENTTINKEETDTQIEAPSVRTLGEDHYLPMSPRKMSVIEPAHKTILENLSVFDHTMPATYEDNPYVEMTLGTEDDDAQAYEIVCVNNGKAEPVYMELNHVDLEKSTPDEVKTDCVSDTASNFADTKEQTLKRISKIDKNIKEKADSSDTEEESSKDVSLDMPFSRFSISDNFRPASYYLSGSRTILDRQDSSDSDIVPPPPIPTSSPPFDDLLNEELSKYILDKLDKSDLPQDNSIIKMLTSENQNLNKMKRKTTSLMIYGSRTSIHDTLTRGEKVRSSRASLTLERNKVSEIPNNVLSNSIIEQHNISCNETDSLRSYNADKASSRLSVESDTSSRFEMTPSNISSEITSLVGSDSMVDLRHPYEAYNFENAMKRRPLSDDSIFELTESENIEPNVNSFNINFDEYLESLGTSATEVNTLTPTTKMNNTNTIPAAINSFCANKNSTVDQMHNLHMRSSSTPVSQNSIMHLDEDRNSTGNQNNYNNNHSSECLGSQSSCSSAGIPKSPLSFYSKSYNRDTLKKKNLNSDILADKIKEFESEKLSMRHSIETTVSSTSTGFHSRESSAEHSAPYYYSDLSSQEHINVLPISHYLKNTNIHRKLNNQRRRGPMHRKNEISHIHNPIRDNDVLLSEQPFDLAASARSVSVEFLSVVEKNPDIDLKNIYESSSSKISKIPESMNLISSLGCKKSLKNKNCEQSSSLVGNNISHSSVHGSPSHKVSSGSMSSHCSENSSNTVYYDAETEASAYENVLYQGEKHWDEDVLWRDNLRRVSHRHARSMDDLDSLPIERTLSDRPYENASAMNSIKRVKKNIPDRSTKSVTYVNCDIRGQVQRNRDGNTQEMKQGPNEEKDENDVYVRLVKNAEILNQQSDEGVYEQLTIGSSENPLTLQDIACNSQRNQNKNRRRFEIDRENLRQWDLMSSGLMKSEVGCVRSVVAGLGTNEPNCNREVDRASNEGIL
ncbi:serine-rich adhesin for platelets isoform X2 [Maniola hyperantus]